MDLDVTNVASKGTGINWPVLRYADVLLLLAEAENEISGAPTARAKEMLKLVRERAFVNANNKTEMVDDYIGNLNSYEDFKKAIIDERAWEFGGENIRKFDLVRWNYYGDAIVNTIEWIRDAVMNYQQLELVDGEFIYNSEKEIKDMGIAPKLYYTYENGEVAYVNDYFTYFDATDTPYKDATKLGDSDIKTTGATFDGMKYVDFTDGFMSVSDTDPETKQKYGTDENGNVIKKGVFNESIIYSWYGFTNGVLVKGHEDLSLLRGQIVPYVFPIPTDRITSSNGILSNDGYAIRNK